jgi:tetratricopeptide (TPR) repeat protein
MGVEAGNNYYERLGVDKAADAQQVKRAYYTLVKQFPPERFPEEYKRLRAAYDALSDEKSRAEYDSGLLLPKGAAALMDQAKRLDAAGWMARSAEIYEQVLRMYPNLEQAMTALAISYEEQDKNGKAASLWEKLCARDPKNAESAYKLAMAYERRSWRKKAVAQYERALELDGGNADCWVALLKCQEDHLLESELREICERAIRELRQLNRESIRLYAYAAAYCAPAATDAAERHLGAIVRILRTGGARDCDLENMVQFLLGRSSRRDDFSFIPYIREMSKAIAIKDGELQGRLNKAFREPDIVALEERGFSKKLQDLLDTLNDGCDCDHCRRNKLALECLVLEDGEAIRADIMRLREEFPDLYALHADFFSEVLRARDMRKMLYRWTKTLSKEGISPDRLAYGGATGRSRSEWPHIDQFLDDWLDAIEADEPQPAAAQRTAARPAVGQRAAAQAAGNAVPKTGRNDPCPCGSGKKYKPCCGRLAV